MKSFDFVSEYPDEKSLKKPVKSNSSQLNHPTQLLLFPWKHRHWQQQNMLPWKCSLRNNFDKKVLLAWLWNHLSKALRSWKMFDTVNYNCTQHNIKQSWKMRYLIQAIIITSPNRDLDRLSWPVVWGWLVWFCMSPWSC